MQLNLYSSHNCRILVKCKYKCVWFPNLPDENVKVATDFASLVETAQNKTVCWSAPGFVDCQCQTEQIELNNNNCGCSCGIIAA